MSLEKGISISSIMNEYDYKQGVSRQLKTLYGYIHIHFSDKINNECLNVMFNVAKIKYKDKKNKKTNNFLDFENFYQSIKVYFETKQNTLSIDTLSISEKIEYGYLISPTLQGTTQNLSAQALAFTGFCINHKLCDTEVLIQFLSNTKSLGCKKCPKTGNDQALEKIYKFIKKRFQ
jgi:hypothetical protein